MKKKVLYIFIVVLLISSTMKSFKKLQKNQRLFIVFEGIDGSGKSTLAKKLYEYLKEHEYDCILTREPGGTDFKKPLYELFEICAKYDNGDLSTYLLFAAERALHINTIIKPALDNNCVVISDRFIDSSRVYQSSIGQETINTIFNLSNQNMQPDIIIFCDVDPEVAKQRMKERGKDFLDHVYENKLHTLRNNYVHLYKNNDCVITINTSHKTIDELFSELLNVMY
jgi:dTMP kinase